MQTESEYVTAVVSAPGDETEVAQQQEYVVALPGSGQSPLETMELINPVPDVTHITRGLTDGHRGVDFAAPVGSLVVTATGVRTPA